MPKIIVLNDDQRWSDYTGCNIITLSDEAYDALVLVDGKFSCDIPIIEQQQLSELDTDWEAVCGQFYHACGGMYGCGECGWIDDLIKTYHTYFEGDEEEEDSMENDGFWYEESEDES